MEKKQAKSTTTATTIRLTRDIARRIKALALTRSESYADIIDRLLVNGIALEEAHRAKAKMFYSVHAGKSDVTKSDKDVKTSTKLQGINAPA